MMYFPHLPAQMSYLHCNISLYNHCRKYCLHHLPDKMTMTALDKSGFPVYTLLQTMYHNLLFLPRPLTPLEQHNLTHLFYRCLHPCRTNNHLQQQFPLYTNKYLNPLFLYLRLTPRKELFLPMHLLPQTLIPDYYLFFHLHIPKPMSVLHKEKNF